MRSRAFTRKWDSGEPPESRTTDLLRNGQAGLFLQSRSKSAISQAGDGKSLDEELKKIEVVIAELPRIGKPIHAFSDSDQLQIISVIVDLFSAKTGLDCSELFTRMVKSPSCLNYRFR